MITNYCVVVVTDYTPSSSLDPKKYFINSEHGFAFKKPDKKRSPVQALKGVAGMYELMPIKNDIFSVENMEEGLKDAKLGPMISNVTIYYFAHEDSKSTVFVTDSTDNDMICEFVNEEANYMFADSTEEYDTTSTPGRRKYQQALVNYRRSIIGFDSMQMKIVFAVSVFSKSALPVNARKLNLPAFYTELSVLFGSIIDKLVADDRQILSGAEFTLNNVMIKKRASDFQSKKWMLCTENNDNFITVELIYSPQISPSINLWDDLQETLKSFTILTEN